MKKRGAINVEDGIDGSDDVESSGIAAVDFDSLGDNVNDVKNNSDDHHNNINHTSVTDDDDVNSNNLNVSIKSIDSNVKTINALHQNNSNIDDNSSTKAKKSKKSKKNSKEEIVHNNNNSVEIINPLFDAKHVVDDVGANDDGNDGGNPDNITLSNDNNSIVIMDEIKNSNISSTIISSIKGKQNNQKTNNNKINNSSSIIKMNDINIADSNNDINNSSNSHQVNVVHKGRQLIAFGIPVAFNKKMFRTIATLGCPKTEVELLKEVR